MAGLEDPPPLSVLGAAGSWGGLTGDPVEAAPRLLGAVLSARDVDGTLVAVRITEVEAYRGVGEDPGSHAQRGRTARNATMFGPVGGLYVYFTYGMHWCLNVVVHADGGAGAVLVRAGEVVQGRERARERRAGRRGAPVDRDLARGPARLAQALGVTGVHDGADLFSSASPLRLEAGVRARQVAAGPRVGVSGPGGDAERYPWRFWLPGEPTVSVYRAAVRRSRDRGATETPGAAVVQDGSLPDRIPGARPEVPGRT